MWTLYYIGDKTNEILLNIIFDRLIKFIIIIVIYNVVFVACLSSVYKL